VCGLREIERDFEIRLVGWLVGCGERIYLRHLRPSFFVHDVLD
jgi:hypothetical protein